MCAGIARIATKPACNSRCRPRVAFRYTHLVGTSVQLIDVVSWSMLIVFSLAAMALAWLAIFGDKPRGKARCPRCWYELGRLDSPPALPVTCPECGKKVHAPRQLRRRRIKRWPVLAAIPLAITAWIGWKLPEIDERGWLWLLPNRVVFELLPVTGYRGEIGDELQRRLGKSPWPSASIQQTLTDDDVAAFIRRASRGNIFARPTELGWRLSYGDAILDVWGSDRILNSFKMELLDGPLDTARKGGLVEAFDLATTIPPLISVRHRDRWPDDSPRPYKIAFDIAHWWPISSDISATVEWTARNERGETSRGDGLYKEGEAILDVRLSGDITIDGMLTLSITRLKPPIEPDVSVHKIPFRVTYATVPSAADAVPRFADPKLDLLLAQLNIYFDGPIWRVRADVLRGSGYEDVAIGARVVARWRGDVLAEGSVEWTGLGGGEIHWRAPRDPKAVESLWFIRGMVPPGVTITFTSDPDAGPYQLNATRAWVGEVMIPVATSSDTYIR